MAGVINTTARQFNLKAMQVKKVDGEVVRHRVTVRIAPGLNSVRDDHWEAFVQKGKPVDKYVAGLIKKGAIVIGDTAEEAELEKAPDTKSKSKAVVDNTKADKK